MSGIKIETYSGYKADERPVRIILRDRVLEVLYVEDQWYGPSVQYFRVRASDDNMYILCHNRDSDAWSLDAFRQDRIR